MLLGGLSMYIARLFHIFSDYLIPYNNVKNMLKMTPLSVNFSSSWSLPIHPQIQTPIISPSLFPAQKSQVLKLLKESHYSSPCCSHNLARLNTISPSSLISSVLDRQAKARDSRSSIEKTYQSLIIKLPNIIKRSRMSDIEQNAKHKKRYSKISTEKRIKLVQMVFDQGFTITRAAKLLHVKRPTAKIILKRYQQNGTFFNKRMPEVKKKTPEPKKTELVVEKRQNECVSEEKEESVQLKVQQNEEMSPQSTNPLGSFMPYTFVYYYQPYFDYHCFT